MPDATDPIDRLAELYEAATIGKHGYACPSISGYACDMCAARFDMEDKVFSLMPRILDVMKAGRKVADKHEGIDSSPRGWSALSITIDALTIALDALREGGNTDG